MALPAWVNVEVLEGLRDTLKDVQGLYVTGFEDRRTRFFNTRRFVFEFLKSDAIGGDADSQRVVEAFYVFLKNDDASDHSYTYNGQVFSLSAGKVYSLVADEAQFFITKALEQNHNLVLVPSSDYFGVNGRNTVFCW